MKKKYWLVGLIATVGFVSTQLTATGQEASRAERSPEPVVTTIPSRGSEKESKPMSPKPVQSEADELESRARADFGSNFAGLSVNGDSLQVNVKGPVETKVAKQYKSLRSNLRYSLDELEAFSARVTENSEKLRANGVQMGIWGVDPATNSVSISAVQEAQAGLRSTPATPALVSSITGLALDAVTLTEGERYRLLNGQRNADFSPHNSGAQILPQGGGWCTSSSFWTGPNGYVMLTAAHCIKPGR
jgi:hypothetical protein